MFYSVKRSLLEQYFHSFKTGFLTFTLLTCGLGDCPGGCPVYHRMVFSILGLDPPEVSSSPPVCDNQKCLQAVPSLPWRAKPPPSSEALL